MENEIMFGVSLIATDPGYKLVLDNCIQVSGCIHIYEGELFLFDEEYLFYELIGFCSVPSLGGLSKKQLREIVCNKFGYTEKQFKNLRLRMEKKVKKGAFYKLEQNFQDTQAGVI